VVRSHGIPIDHWAARPNNVAPPCLVSFELEIKIAQLEHAYVHPGDQRAAM